MPYKITPGLVTTSDKKLVGMQFTMSLSDNKTGILWSAFMKARGAIKNNLTNNLISMQIYDPEYFKDFRPSNVFEKWAAVEVRDFNAIPPNMNTFTLPGGLYAVFDYKGRSDDPGIFQFIFGTWLPNSNYLMDDRPHFEILGEKYKNNDPNSEEEIWIPVRTQ